MGLNVCRYSLAGSVQVVDTVIYAVNGRRAFKLDADVGDVTVDSLEDWQIAVLFICQVGCSGAADCPVHL